MEEVRDDAARERLLAAEVETGNGHSYGRAKIEVWDLTRISDKDERILNKLNLDIPRGMIMAVIGPNGNGKSTFLRALNRLWQPPVGSVVLDGVSDQASACAGKLACSSSSQLYSKLRGKKLSDVEVDKLLALADLDPCFSSKLRGELSVGQAQRVALARTLANEPEVLLLDEPTSSLDPISTQHVDCGRHSYEAEV